jgi:hypothetical protein
MTNAACPRPAKKFTFYGSEYNMAIRFRINTIKNKDHILKMQDLLVVRLCHILTRLVWNCLLVVFTSGYLVFWLSCGYFPLWLSYLVDVFRLSCG